MSMLDSSPEDEDFPGRLLHQAALWDNAELLEDLLHGDQLSLINSRDNWGRTPLHAAAITENSRCLAILLRCGGDPDIQCGPRGENRTALHLSSEHGHYNNIATLVDHGASLLIRDANGMTALDIADKSDHSSCMLLLRQAADAREKQRHEIHEALREACLQGDISSVRKIIASIQPPSDAELVINMAPSGANTLLFAACQVGRREIVRVLLDNGADGRFHPVTKYSPLYIACYHGHKDIVEMLLTRFPELVCQHTVERWLPIHACCINGHTTVMDLLFHFPYPHYLLNKYSLVDFGTKTGVSASVTVGSNRQQQQQEQRHQIEYLMPFDVNDRDVTGQNILYVACLLGNVKMVDIILKFRVKTLVDVDSAVLDTADLPLRHEPQVQPMSPTRRRISYGIQTIMSKLNLSRGDSSESECGSNNDSSGQPLTCPLQLDMYCNNGTETALHAAVKGRHYDIVLMLLQAGANPNLTIRAEHDPVAMAVDSLSGDDECGTGKSTALVEACRNRDLTMAELLLKHGARDDECRALCVAVRNRDEVLTARLLSIKANPDPEYKINKRAMTDASHASGVGAGIFSGSSSGSGSSTYSYSSLFPNVPAMINWHNQRCHLSQLRMNWLTDAALQLNPRLKQNPRCHEVALCAITRLDVSSNSLTMLPLELFQLCSLRHLNLAQNKIERLPEPRRVGRGTEQRAAGRRFGNATATATIVATTGYRCPALEELYIQDNRLEEVPDDVFLLPSLVTLVLSNNKLQRLPFVMWRSPKLKELNVSFNLLRELPGTATRDILMSSIDQQFVVSNRSMVTVHRLSVSSSDGQLSEHGGDEHFSAIAVRHTKKDGMLVQLEPNRHHLWCTSIDVSEQITMMQQQHHQHQKVHSPTSPDDLDHELVNYEQVSQLSSFNLAHNLFTSIPPPLSCLAINLTRLNMAFNNLRSMSHITSYPSSLKQLDLSHNQVSCWPSLPQVGARDAMELANLACYGGRRTQTSCSPDTDVASQNTSVTSRSRSVRTAVLQSVCPHRRHLRLDNLRTLVLAGNQLTRIQLSTDDDGVGGGGTGTSAATAEESAANIVADNRPQRAHRNRLMFPNLSMLDVSNNVLKEIPANINELTNLSVLNVSGNPEVSELPPQMGLLSRLWNLNTRGCSLQEPLRSMIDSKKYKTMDIVGYLKSVLEDAKPYARMKLMIVGVQGIGKTSLLEQLRQEGGGQSSEGGGSLHGADHWARRMGNKNMGAKTSRGANMSTVGVDIGDWVYEKRPATRSCPSHGPVTFRTWDFGGQREYYATHQYFLSRRSLYLVVWRIVDGQRGTDEILQWLVNIQARAPNSPVLIVGTHFDLAQPASSEELQQSIRDRFINVVDAEKCGLPRVLDTIEISCRTRHNIRLLCNLVYDTVFSLRPAGSKELLLEQRVPASYLALEDVVGHVASERRAAGLDPVLDADQYRTVVAADMTARFGRTFRDQAELHQATLFLHENGVLLHYDDATLRDLYFLDPQWLCDMLAHVVTIREINPFARTGVMKLDDLKHVFRASNMMAGTMMDTLTRGYVVSLLNKFEVALTWDSRTLLIPSLLPSEEELLLRAVRVRVPLRSRGWATVRHTKKQMSVSPRSVLYEQVAASATEESIASAADRGLMRDAVTVTRLIESGRSITRLLLMSYFPSGFWSRLMSRILGDDNIVDIVRSYLTVPKEAAQDVAVARALDELRAEWLLWQTGLELRYGEATLFRMREILRDTKLHQQDQAVTVPTPPYRQLRFRLKQDGAWCEVDLAHSSILEIHFPMDALLVTTAERTVEVRSTAESVTQLLALAVDHVDILLEDWYPTLGTRFVHTSEGRFLVTRLVPCPRCLSLQPSDTYIIGGSGGNNSIYEDTFGKAAADLHAIRRSRKSQESYTGSEADSGVGPDSSAGSSRMPSVEGRPDGCDLDAGGPTLAVHVVHHYSWMVEECILAAYDDGSGGASGRCVSCPCHGDVPLSVVAPDTMFLDLGERHLIRPENIKRGRLLGRGAFGFVFRGTCKNRGSNTVTDVAMKMLQPVAPGPAARQSAVIAYRAAQGKWDRDPLQYACKAYCTARQELNILLSLRHPNIVPLVGVCVSPLALVLDLAPHGALDAALRHYRRSGAVLAPRVLRQLVVQVARAIEYLHRQRIIYRDLKSENVLVWQLPDPFDDGTRAPAAHAHTHVKLADYGISRLTLPSGTKGFGGTEGFMAPEIMRHNGEEEYTEKVDCFSFGMFVYELLTLRQPFEGHEAVKECILEGGRPSLTHRETQLHPSYCLDLMVRCWSQQPRDRPTASQIVSIASAPEFTHLTDAVSLRHGAPVVVATAVPVTHIFHAGVHGRYGSELWLACANLRIDLLLAVQNHGWLQYHSFAVPHRPTAMCAVPRSAAGRMTSVWIADCAGWVHCHSAATGTRLGSRRLPVFSTHAYARCLLHLDAIGRVACGLSNGRLLLLDPDAIELVESPGGNANHRPFDTTLTVEGSKMEPRFLHALCFLETVSELWVGECHGRIAVYPLHHSAQPETCDSLVHLNHHEPSIDNVDVLHLATGGDGRHVWSYVYPGCIVYQWERDGAGNRNIVNRLDCSKLVPCSESLKSIAIEEHLSPGKCQVTGLAVLRTELYIATTWGCLIVVERENMCPITVFRPYEEDVRVIVPLVCEGDNPTHQFMATVGRGYRNLLSRYTSDPQERQRTDASISTSDPAMFALLWRTTDNWASA